MSDVSFASFVDETVRKISENRAKIIDDYIKVMLANSSLTEQEIRENLDKMVLHERLDSVIRNETSFYVTFDGNMRLGDWQPIETAPKDGTHILLYVEGSVIEGYWYSYWEEWEVVALSSHGCGCCSCGNDDPLYWMPLPEVPDEDL